MTECGSTNDLARAWALDTENPAPHGALVTADFQTQGRGRRGRRWDARASESALMSFVLRPEMPLADAWHLGFMTSLATADALRRFGLEAQLKWPNDVLLHRSKVAGILVETTFPQIAVAGIGINVNQSAFQAEDYAYPPTSLRLETRQDWMIGEVIEAVAKALGHWEAVYGQEGFAPILAAWREHLALDAVLKRGSESGSLVAVTSAGHAHVRLTDGTFAEWTALE